MEAQEFYDKELSNYNLLNLIDPATAKQAMQMMEEYHQTKLNLLNIPDVIVSGVGKYNKMAGIHDKYTCPICGNSPDVVHPNRQESTCFKDEIKWEYN